MLGRRIHFSSASKCRGQDGVLLVMLGDTSEEHVLFASGKRNVHVRSHLFSAPDRCTPQDTPKTEAPVLPGLGLPAPSEPSVNVWRSQISKLFHERPSKKGCARTLLGQKGEELFRHPRR